jgi:hypothetical protein
MCESACSEGEDFPLSFSPVKLALPPSFSLTLSLSLPLPSSSAKSEEHMGHNSLGRDGSLEVNERGFFSQGTRSLVSTPGYLPWHTPSFPSSSFWMWAPTLNCQSLPMASPAYPPINSLSLWSFSQHAIGT